MGTTDQLLFLFLRFIWAGKLPPASENATWDFHRVTPQVVNLMPTQIGASLATMSEDEAQDLVLSLAIILHHPYSQAVRSSGELSEIFLRTGFFLVASGYGIPGKLIQHCSEFPCTEICRRLNLNMVELGPMLAKCCAIAGIPPGSPFLKQLGLSPLSSEDSILIDPGFRAFYNTYLWHYPRAATRDNLKLTAPWSIADAVLDPAEALPPDAMPIHTTDKLGSKTQIKEYGSVENPCQIMVFIPGGGMALGDVDSDSKALQKMRLALGFPILSIGYTRGPFPLPLETTYEALDWIKARYRAAEVVLAGVSSGGNLALVAALDRYADWIRGMCLVAPSLDNTQDAQRRHKGASPWFTTERMELYQRMYVPSLAARADWKVSPIKAPPEVLRRAKTFDVSMYIMSADILREENEAFVERLTAYGCRVRRKLYQGYPHMALSVQGALGYGMLIDLVADVRAMLAGNLCPEALNGGTIEPVVSATDAAILQSRLSCASEPLAQSFRQA